MRILHILPSLGVGGAERMALHLCTWLLGQGYEVEVGYLSPPHTLYPDFASKGIFPRYLRTLPVLSRWYPREIERYLRQLKPDLVHCHSVVWRKVGLACRNTHTPCLLTLHGYYAGWIDTGRRWMSKLVPYTDYIVGVSEQIVQLVRERLDVCEDKLVFIPNGIPDVASEPQEGDLLLPSGLRSKAVVGTIARLEPPKDFDTLLQAVAIAKQNVENITLLIAGEGSLRKAIEERACELKILDQVHLLGYVSNVASFLRSVDVFVLSSLSEGMPISILEAMCMERPIVATNVGAISMLLENGRCGVLVQPGEAHAMANAIVKLLRDRHEAGRLASCARVRYEEEFTVDAMSTRYLNLYRRMVERRGTC